jgi:tetratricopeptide (TPR) repeat protein
MKKNKSSAFVPGLVSFIMLCTSFMPWLHDPLGDVYFAWVLPVDIGWQFHTLFFNYGLLCDGCAVYVFFVTYSHLMRAKKPADAWDLTRGYTSAALLCMIPFLLFLLQYLVADVHDMDVLAQHAIQAVLIYRHFGYRVSTQLIVLNPFNISTATFAGRFELLTDYIAPGPFVSLAGSCILIGARRVYATSQAPHLPAAQGRSGSAWFLILPFVLFMVLVAGRSSAAMVCEYAARVSLSTGDNATALRWLGTALVLNPALDQVPYYHIERGQAYYFLNPDTQNDDSRIYLAFVYREQGDDLDALQEDIAAWRAHPTTPWIIDELSITLTRMAEFTQKPGGPPVQRASTDIAAMTWLQMLLQADSSNVYSRYVMGRFEYYLHGYGQCMALMKDVIQLSNDSDIQSSAYTYIGLSVESEGDIADARKILLKAEALDPEYHNNTAREELSGLH